MSIQLENWLATGPENVNTGAKKQWAILVSYVSDQRFGLHGSGFKNEGVGVCCNKYRQFIWGIYTQTDDWTCDWDF